ncbi:MAG: P-II family nitrogen regulator [Bacilli bacterium]
MENDILIVVVINKGFTDLVMEAAKKSGANGGTVFNARGTGNPDMEKFYGIVIKPDKEVVLIVVNDSIKETVLKAINEAAGLETKGQGVAFALPVTDVVGFTTLPKQKQN